MPKTKKFDPADLPKYIIVYREDDDDEPYLVAQVGIDGLGHDKIVGRYELLGLGRVAVGVTLEEI